MSLDASLIPTLNNEETLREVAERMGIELDLEDPLSLIEFSLKYQAIIRYQYADAMLAVRGRD